MESYTLTTPLSVTAYRVQKLVLDWENKVIKVKVKDLNGSDIINQVYTGDTAQNLMNQLNKLDLSTNSLHKRILTRLNSDGVLALGTVTGSPD